MSGPHRGSRSKAAVEVVGHVNDSYLGKYTAFWGLGSSRAYACFNGDQVEVQGREGDEQ